MLLNSCLEKERMKDSQLLLLHSNFEILLDRCYGGPYSSGRESFSFHLELCSLEPPFLVFSMALASGLWEVLLCPVLTMALTKWVLGTVLGPGEVRGPSSNLKAYEVSLFRPSSSYP